MKVVTTPRLPARDEEVVIVLCSIGVFDLPRLCGDIEKLMMASSTAPEEPSSCYWRLCLYGFYSNSQDEVERENVDVILEEATEPSKNGYKQNLSSIYKSIKNKRTKRKQKNVENLISKEEEAEYDGDDDSTAASSSNDDVSRPDDEEEEYDDLEQGPSHSTPFHHHPHKQNVKLVSILRNPQQKSKKKHFFGKKQKRRRRKHVTWKDGGAQEEEEEEEEEEDDDDSEYENPNITKVIDEWRVAEWW